MIVFVSDAYKEDYIGGAELTTEAIIEDSLLPVVNIVNIDQYPNTFKWKVLATVKNHDMEKL